ncbi:DNA circularization N-terminal domain-containing protein, partial [Escherichia coli]
MDLSSFPTRPSLLSSSSGWRDRLQDASFRGVPFKVEEESAGTGRRVETHEY